MPIFLTYRDKVWGMIFLIGENYCEERRFILIMSFPSDSEESIVYLVCLTLLCDDMLTQRVVASRL